MPSIPEASAIRTGNVDADGFDTLVMDLSIPDIGLALGRAALPVCQSPPCSPNPTAARARCRQPLAGAAYFSGRERWAECVQRVRFRTLCRRPDMFSPSCRVAANDTGNQLLAKLPSDAWHRLKADLERIELTQGQTLQEAGAPLQYVYFPTTAVVSLVSGMRDGGSAGLAMVGNEGMVGVCAFMGGGDALSGGVVQTAGHGWRMLAAALACHAASQESVMLPLLRYAQALFVQLGQTSACHCHHSVQQQLCCWLLLHQDRHPGNDLLLTHERIADLLGVRRETVTSGAFKLQKLGLIRYARGHIVILDRRGLEDCSCECYAVVKSAYDKLSDEVLVEPRATGRPGVDNRRMLTQAAPALRQPDSLWSHRV